MFKIFIFQLLNVIALILLNINKFENLILNIVLIDYLKFDKCDKNDLYFLKNRCNFDLLKFRNENEKENIKLLNDF